MTGSTRAARRAGTNAARRRGENDGDCYARRRVGRAAGRRRAGARTTSSPRRRAATPAPGRRRPRAGSGNDQHAQRSGTGAEREPNPDLPAAANDGGCHRRVEADDQQHQRRRAEKRADGGQHPLLTERAVGLLVERQDSVDEETGIDLERVLQEPSLVMRSPSRARRMSVEIDRFGRRRSGSGFRFRHGDLRDWKEDPVGCGFAEMLVAKVPDDADDLDVECPRLAERDAATDRAATCPKARAASVSLTMATRGARASSAAVKSRPLRIGSASAAK